MNTTVLVLTFVCCPTSNALDDSARWRTNKAGDVVELRVPSGHVRFASDDALRSTVETLDLSDSLADDRSLRDLIGFSKLKKLNLSNTAITDDGLRHLARIPTLQSLALRLTGITDRGVTALRGLQLESLDLSGVRVSDDSLDVLRRMPLTTLNLNGTMVSNDCLPHFAGMRVLRELHLSYTQISSLEGLPVTGWTSLRYLDVSGSKINRLPKLPPRLNNLSIHSTNVSRLPQTLTGVGKLAVGPGFDDKSIGSINAMHGLDELSLFNTHITSDGFRRLRLPNLTSLHVASSLENADLSRFPKLTTISLGGTSLSTKLVRSACGCRTLKKLRITDADVTVDRSVISDLASLPNLETLDLALGFQLDDRELKLISRIRSLKSLKLNHCSATADGFGHLGRLKHLTEVSILSNNNSPRLADPVVVSLCKIKSLRSLDLWGARLGPDALDSIVEHPNLEQMTIRTLDDREKIKRLRKRFGRWNLRP